MKYKYILLQYNIILINIIYTSVFGCNNNNNGLFKYNIIIFHLCYNDIYIYIS